MSNSNCLIIENTSLIANYIKLCLTTSKYISCTYWYFILSGGCAIVLADGKVLDGSGTSSRSLTVIVTGTTLTEGSFQNWDNSYMTLVNEG